MPLDEAIASAGEDIARAAEQALRSVLVGLSLAARRAPRRAPVAAEAKAPFPALHAARRGAPTARPC
jgi:hypothetical protein